jgi:hypothetical protein
MYRNYKQATQAIIACALSLAAVSCRSVYKTASVPAIQELHLLGTYVIPHKQQFAGTTVGGLSGIDYDARRKLYYLICDDRSAMNPARFYTASIAMNERGIDSVHLVAVTSLRQPGGSVYPDTKTDPLHTPDPESMRYDPVHDQLIWGSEGERIVKKDVTVLEDASIIAIKRSGAYIDSFVLPSNMHMHADAHGPRQNGVFEGSSFIDNYKKLLVSVEEPIYEDGPRAGLRDSSGLIRILSFDVATRKPLAQYGYSIDPVPYAPVPEGSFRINGVPDILAINSHQLIVIERAFSTGRRGCVVKLYLAELDGAEDVSGRVSLRGTAFKAVQKKLLLNMDQLERYIDNVEGVTLGPVLPNGHRSLVLVADDNFDPDEETQFFLFEIR